MPAYWGVRAASSVEDVRWACIVHPAPIRLAKARMMRQSARLGRGQQCRANHLDSSLRVGERARFFGKLVAGKTTSANCAVSFRKMSRQTSSSTDLRLGDVVQVGVGQHGVFTP